MDLELKPHKASLKIHDGMLSIRTSKHEALREIMSEHYYDYQEWCYKIPCKTSKIPAIQKIYRFLDSNSFHISGDQLNNVINLSLKNDFRFPCRLSIDENYLLFYPQYDEEVKEIFRKVKIKYDGFKKCYLLPLQQQYAIFKIRKLCKSFEKNFKFSFETNLSLMIHEALEINNKGYTWYFDDGKENEVKSLQIVLNKDLANKWITRINHPDIFYDKKFSILIIPTTITLFKIVTALDGLTSLFDREDIVDFFQRGKYKFEFEILENSAEIISAYDIAIDNLLLPYKVSKTHDQYFRYSILANVYYLDIFRSLHYLVSQREWKVEGIRALESLIASQEHEIMLSANEY